LMGKPPDLTITIHENGDMSLASADGNQVFMEIRFLNGFLEKAPAVRASAVDGAILGLFGQELTKNVERP